MLETWRGGGGGAEGGGGDGVVVQEQLLDAEAEPPEEVLAIVRRRRLLPAAERGEEDALLAPGGGVVEAREQGPELGVGGVAGGRAPLEEGLHGGLGILLHAHAAHGWMDGWMEIERERERGSTAGQQPVVRGVVGESLPLPCTASVYIHGSWHQAINHPPRVTFIFGYLYIHTWTSYFLFLSLFATPFPSIS